MERSRGSLVIIFAVVAAVLLVGAGLFTMLQPRVERDTLYQVGSLDDLAHGRLDGDSTVSRVLEQGDIGLGTFNALNGEMIVIDGRCYRASADGTVTEVPSGELTPFAQVSRFDEDGSVAVNGRMNMSEVEALLDASLPSSTVFYLLRVDGTFTVTVRSVPAQERPYPPLEDVIANQTVFRYENVQGTLVGLWSPPSSSGLSSSGYHFHFISDDRTKGGHVLELELEDLTVRWDSTPRYEVDLR